MSVFLFPDCIAVGNRWFGECCSDKFYWNGREWKHCVYVKSQTLYKKGTITSPSLVSSQTIQRIFSIKACACGEMVCETISHPDLLLFSNRLSRVHCSKKKKNGEWTAVYTDSLYCDQTFSFSTNSTVRHLPLNILYLRLNVQDIVVPFAISLQSHRCIVRQIYNHISPHTQTYLSQNSIRARNMYTFTLNESCIRGVP